MALCLAMTMLIKPLCRESRSQILILRSVAAHAPGLSLSCIESELFVLV